jgi:hypothetical protein
MSRVGMREAATQLALLHPADRRWLLGRLPVRHAETLKALLATAPLRRLASSACVNDGLAIPESASRPELPRRLRQELDRLDPRWAATATHVITSTYRDTYRAMVGVDRARRMDERTVEQALLPPLATRAIARFLVDRAGQECVNP